MSVSQRRRLPVVNLLKSNSGLRDRYAHQDSVLVELQEKMKATHESLAEAIKDNNSIAQEWVIKSIWQPGRAGSLAVPRPKNADGEVTRRLCKKYHVEWNI